MQVVCVWPDSVWANKLYEEDNQVIYNYLYGLLPHELTFNVKLGPKFSS